MQAASQAPFVSQQVGSANHFLAMLNGEEVSQQVYALKKLDRIVDYQWHEISDALPQIESLVDEESFPERALAASVGSKVFYHLEEYDDALRLALEAGDKFDIMIESKYVLTLVHKAIDTYTEQRVQIHDRKQEGVEIDPRMEAIVNRKFEQCFGEGKFKQAIGIALETKRIDMVKQSIERSSNPEAMLGYAFTLATETIKSKDFRSEILNTILEVYESKSEGGNDHDYYKIAKCQFHLNRPDQTAKLLIKLLTSTKDEEYLIAYQIAFDVVEKESQSFIQAVIAQSTAAAATLEDKTKFEKLLTILKGSINERLYLQFLKKNNHTDMLLINQVKNSIGNKKSVLHTATIWMNAVMNAYTTNDAFLRDNLGWAESATNWNRFMVISSLGMIHQGNKSEADKILTPYFAGGQGPNNSPYCTAGAYYAYGLIHSNYFTPETYEFFMNGYKNAGQVESVQHGVSLGLGLVAMATKNQEVYEQLKNTLYANADSATIGEAAAYSMGMVMLGSADERAIEEMMTHAADSQHEKIIRALSISLALLMQGREEQADGLIEQMTRSKDAIMRQGAMYAIGCAYAGTMNSQATQKLLKFAVSDVNDDVKRAAVTNVGFLLFRKPKLVPETVKHLADSHNPHLRYGAAMAVGIGCSGTGLNEALRLLAPLTNDQTDFVRQGALIALSLVFVQVTESQEPKVGTIKKLFKRMTSDRNEEILSRMGSIISNGIINAAGRNATICLTTRDGNVRQNAVTGLVLFMQHWYWYPMLNFVTLAMTPTALIAVNKDLKVPKSFEIKLNAKPSLFKYPEFLKKEEAKTKEKVETAVLSTTAKVKARVDRKKKEEGDAEPESEKKDEKMEVDKEEKKEEEKKEEEEKKQEPEVTEAVLKNPSRVVKQQEESMQYLREDKSRYYPILDSRFSGFVVLKDLAPGTAVTEAGDQEPEQFYDDEERDLSAPNPDLVSDLDIPKPFEFDPAIQNAP